MPWKLILVLVLSSLVLIFIGFNLDNKVTISLGFVTWQAVPVFYVAMVSFFVGFLCALPLFSRRKSKLNQDKDRTNLPF